MHAAHVTTSVIIHSESTIWIIKLLFWIGDKFTLFTEFSRHKQSSSKCHAWLYHLSSCSREWVFQQELHQRQHRWVYETCLTWCHQQAQETGEVFLFRNCSAAQPEYTQVFMKVFCFPQQWQHETEHFIPMSLHIVMISVPVHLTGKWCSG